MDALIDMILQGLTEGLAEYWTNRWIPHIRARVGPKWLQNVLIGLLIVMACVAGIAIAFGLVCLIVLAVDAVMHW